MKLEILLKKAEKANTKADIAANLLLNEIKSKIVVDEDNEEEIRFFENMGCEYNQSDGFIINDEDGNNYSVIFIINVLKNKRKITIADIERSAI